MAKVFDRVMCWLWAVLDVYAKVFDWLFWYPLLWAVDYGYWGWCKFNGFCYPRCVEYESVKESPEPWLSGYFLRCRVCGRRK